MEDEHEANYSMVMPFVAVVSVGGPYEDDAYRAGYEAGQLESVLKHGKPAQYGGVVRTANVAQIDLIAMRFGYTMTKKLVHEHGWTTIELQKADETDSESVKLLLTSPEYYMYRLTTAAEAREVVTAMNDIIKAFGFATIRNLFDLVGHPPWSSSTKWGWTDKLELETRQTDKGVFLVLPPPTRLY